MFSWLVLFISFLFVLRPPHDSPERLSRKGINKQLMEMIENTAML
jgi:hypothetical protein